MQCPALRNTEMQQGHVGVCIRDVQWVGMQVCRCVGKGGHVSVHMRVGKWMGVQGRMCSHASEGGKADGHVRVGNKVCM